MIMNCVSGIKARIGLQVIFVSCAVHVEWGKNPNLETTFLKLIRTGSNPIHSEWLYVLSTLYWF